jgi:Protein of unknown function (DUF2917)
MEMIMRTLLDIRPITLARGSVHRIENGKGSEVFCLEGALWITQEGDPRDIALVAGRSFELDRKGVAVVYALRDAAITVGAPGHIAPASAPRRAA